MVNAVILASLLALSPLGIESVGCLTEALYYEARGESEEGYIAVANVIMNRVHSHRYPNTVCEVVHQRKQFSYYSDGRPEDFMTNGTKDEVALDIIVHVAIKAIHNELHDTVDGRLFYYAHKKVIPKWACEDGLIISNHTFC